jgi:hypothetical protein
MPLTINGPTPTSWLWSSRFLIDVDPECARAVDGQAIQEVTAALASRVDEVEQCAPSDRDVAAQTEICTQDKERARRYFDRTGWLVI